MPTLVYSVHMHIPLQHPQSVQRTHPVEKTLYSYIHVLLLPSTTASNMNLARIPSIPRARTGIHTRAMLCLSYALYFCFLGMDQERRIPKSIGLVSFSWKRHLIIIFISENKEVLDLHIDWGWTAPLGSRRSGGRLTATTEVRCRSRIQLVSRATHQIRTKKEDHEGA